jgi:hypothetical protein
MQVQIGQSVTYDVEKVVVPMLVLRISEGLLHITCPYEWRDAQGKSLRTGFNIYMEAELDAAFASMGQDFGPVKAVLKTLIPTPMGNVKVLFNEDGTLESETVSPGVNPDGKHWVTVKKDATQFAAAISPLTCDQLKAMVAAFSQMIFA